MLGWHVRDFTVKVSDPATFPSAMTSAIKGGAKFVIISAVDASIYRSILPLAKSKGAVIIDTNSTNPAVPGVVQPVLSSSMAVDGGLITGQALLGDATARHVPAHVGEVTLPIYASVLKPVGEGLRRALSTCSACTLSQIDIPAENFQNGTTASVITSYLQAHPSINYLFFDASGFDAGLQSQLRVAGVERPRMFGMAAQPTEIEAVQSGQQQAWSVDPSEVHGWIMMDVAARILVGDNPNVWTKPLYYVLDQSNSKGVDASNLEYPAGYQAMFKALWRH